MSAKKSTVQSPPKTFEDALRELEALLTQIENGDIGLEESLLKYERGNFLIHHCRGVLNQAEKQIETMGKPEVDDDSVAEMSSSEDSAADED